jgi:hypothetical protein
MLGAIVVLNEGGVHLFAKREKAVVGAAFITPAFRRHPR